MNQPQLMTKMLLIEAISYRAEGLLDVSLPDDEGTRLASD